MYMAMVIEINQKWKRGLSPYDTTYGRQRDMHATHEGVENASNSVFEIINSVTAYKTGKLTFKVIASIHHFLDFEGQQLPLKQTKLPFFI